MAHKEAKDTAFSAKTTLNLGGKIIDLSTPIVMGILNITPDSFHDGGRYTNEKDLLKQTEKMLIEGANVLDIGGVSTRPGAAPITLEEERKRVIQTLKLLVKHFPQTFFSIDTCRSIIAREAVAAGAHMINDISGGRLDEKMFEVVAQLKVPYVLMHMKGTPQTMQTQTEYRDLNTEICDFLLDKIHQLHDLGVSDIIIDPGFGFAKTIKQNYAILKNLKYFQVLKQPILVGLSRKSMIYKSLQITPQEALNGTTVLNTLALMNGASILRVHDVMQAVEAIKLFKLTLN